MGRVMHDRVLGMLTKQKQTSAAQNARQLHVKPTTRQTDDSCGKHGSQHCQNTKTVTKYRFCLAAQLTLVSSGF